MKMFNQKYLIVPDRGVGWGGKLKLQSHLIKKKNKNENLLSFYFFFHWI